jgi:hypothetical protein
VRLRVSLFVLLVVVCAPNGSGQVGSSEDSQSANLLRLEQIRELVVDLASLENETRKLDDSNSKALAQAEIADALWILDQSRAKDLLKQAFKLTLPDEKERERLGNRRIGEDPVEPSTSDIARDRVRRRILQIASRDKDLSRDLALLSEEAGKGEKERAYSRLAIQAVKAGSLELAGNYFRDAVLAEPTRIDLGFVLYEVAARDREAADKLILQYLNQLSGFAFSISSIGRVVTSLDIAVFADPPFDPERRHVNPANPEVIKAYLNFLVGAMESIERNQPGTVGQIRGLLLMQWNRINVYAPELRDRYLALEKTSRRQGDETGPPEPVTRETLDKQYEDILDKASRTDAVTDVIGAINACLARHEFAKARTFAERLRQETTKSQFLEQINLQEALTYAEHGDIQESQRIAGRLTKPTSILRVYPLLIKAASRSGNESLVSSLGIDALNRLKKAEDPEGLLSALAKLADGVSQVNHRLALDFLGEMVSAANKIHADPSSSDFGFIASVFSNLAPLGESEVRGDGEKLEDRFRRVLALAGVYRWKATELTRSDPGAKPANSQPPPGSQRLALTARPSLPTTSLR